METQRIRYIYEIKNLVNGKTYIGQHTLREGRTFETDIYYGSGKLINAAQRKYGLENFEKIIIISGFFTKKQINHFERCMIACQRICGKAEYNLADGGDGGDTSKFINYSDEWRDKVRRRTLEGRIEHFGSLDEYKLHQKEVAQQNLAKDPNYYASKGMTGKHFSEESKQKMRESHLGEKNSQYGKKQSDETKRKKRETRLKSHNALFSKIRLYLEQLNLDKISMNDKVEIGKKFGVSYKTIERCYKEMLNI